MKIPNKLVRRDLTKIVIGMMFLPAKEKALVRRVLALSKACQGDEDIELADDEVRQNRREVEAILRKFESQMPPVIVRGLKKALYG